MKKSISSIVALAAFASFVPLHAEDGDSQATELAKQLANPISSLVSVPFQANEDFRMGPTNNGYKLTLNFQPVIPVSLNSDWNLVIRTIIPYISQHDVYYRDIPSYPGLPDRILAEIPKPLWGEAEKLGKKLYYDEIKKHPQNRGQDGLGDITQSFFFSPKEPGPGGLIWGFGPVFLYPTATQDLLGAGQWGVGPTAVALVQNNGWTVGMLANQIWSVVQNDNNDRRNVNAMFLQPFVAYTTKMHTTFTLNTESTYDWNSSQWTVPINLMVSQILKVGKQPISVQLGGRYYAEGPSGAPEWGLRLNFTLLYPREKPQAAPTDGKAIVR